MNKISELYLYPIAVYFEYCDYREIPDKVLEYLLKSKEEVYRMGYEVLFKFTAVIKLNEDFVTWVNSIEIGDCFRFITIQENVIQEDLGCSNFFYRGIKLHHGNESEISDDPCELKSMVLKDHDNFDMKVKNVV